MLSLTQKRVPLQWAGIQYNLGDALHTLGERENNADYQNQAVIAYRRSVEEWTRRRVPLEWARAHSSMGMTLHALNAVEPSTETLEQALVAFETAFEVQTLERVPGDWARTSYWSGVVLFQFECYPEAANQFANAATIFSEQMLPILLELSVISNDDPAVLVHLGDLYLRLEKRDFARETWSDALAQQPGADLTRALERKLSELR